MRIKTEVIFESDEFRLIGFDRTYLKYKATLVADTDGEIDGIQLYFVSRDEVMPDGGIDFFEYYVAVEIPTDKERAQDIRQLRVWAMPKMFGDSLLQQQNRAASFLQEKIEYA